ncbi:MAG: GNAT family N-acetyltransferase [Caldilineaceae bacterium]|nr:GNAT family N-acetyltransferase [Caldilineaceae bacterium]
MTDPLAPIRSPRLSLIPLTPAFLETSLSDDWAAAERILGHTIHADWYDEGWLMRLRLDDLRKTPAYQPWSVRAIVHSEMGLMIGHTGFHTVPGPDYLRSILRGGVEIGYTIFSDFRGQGYATEACQAMMSWAHDLHQITRFILSIAPDNEASLRVAHKLGFIRIGEHVDAEDGIEYIFGRILD